MRADTTPTEPKEAKLTWPTSAKGYELKAIIGKGATAEVWRAYCDATKRECAIKIVKAAYLSTGPKAMSQMSKEIKILKELEHPNIVKLFTSFIHDEDLWMVMALVDAGSCRDILDAAFPEGMPEPVVAAIGRRILEALAYLHGTEKMHRDIKAGNIMLDSEGRVKLGDFGFVGVFVENGSAVDMRRTFVGTPCWTAPEVYLSKVANMTGYDYSADIWSLGITLIELAKGKAPYQDLESARIVQFIVDSDPPLLGTVDKEDKKRFSSAFRKVISACLVKEPEKRYKAEKLIKMAFFKKAVEPEKTILEQALSKLPAKWGTRQLDTGKPSAGAAPAPRTEAERAMDAFKNLAEGKLSSKRIVLPDEVVTKKKKGTETSAESSEPKVEAPATIEKKPAEKPLIDFSAADES